jgi:hypothetical protein
MEHVSVGYTKRLDQASIEPSVGNKGQSYRQSRHKSRHWRCGICWTSCVIASGAITDLAIQNLMREQYVTDEPLDDFNQDLPF